MERAMGVEGFACCLNNIVNDHRANFISFIMTMKLL